MRLPPERLPAPNLTACCRFRRAMSSCRDASKVEVDSNFYVSMRVDAHGENKQPSHSMIVWLFVTNKRASSWGWESTSTVDIIRGVHSLSQLPKCHEASSPSFPFLQFDPDTNYEKKLNWNLLHTLYLKLKLSQRQEPLWPSSRSRHNKIPLCHDKTPPQDRSQDFALGGFEPRRINLSFVPLPEI
jgi:hypothetical protein